MLLTGVACVRMIGNWWITYSFIIPMHITPGHLYLACLVFLGLFLSKWLSCLLVGMEALGDIEQQLFAVLFCSVLC